MALEQWTRRALAVAVIVLAAGFAYAPVLHGDFVWDDHSEITHNDEIQAPDGLRRIWQGEGSLDYFPLKSSLQWLEWRLFHADTLGYHVANLALHLLGALLVWRLATRLGVRHGWLAGLIFALHPLAVESVAWIAEFKNVLSLPPLLLAAECYLTFDATGRRRAYAGALAWFIVALLCKTSVVTFPLALLLYAGWKRGRVAGRDVRAAAPFLAVAVALGLVTVWFQHHRAIGSW